MQGTPGTPRGKATQQQQPHGTVRPGKAGNDWEKWANLGQNGPFQRKHQITVKQVPLYVLLCKPPPALTFPAPASTGVHMAAPQGEGAQLTLSQPGWLHPMGRQSHTPPQRPGMGENTKLGEVSDLEEVSRIPTVIVKRLFY